MPADQQLTVQQFVRAWLGVDTLPGIEDKMTTFITLLNGLAAQQAEASATQQASFVNLHNAMARLEEQVAALKTAVANGEVSEEVQAAADQISTALTDMKTAADTADDGFEPAEETTPPSPEIPSEPSTDVPAETPAEGDTVPGDGTDGTSRGVRR